MTVAGSRRDDEGIRRFVHPQLAFLAGRSACTFMYEYMALDPFLHDLCPHFAPASCIRTLRPHLASATWVETGAYSCFGSPLTVLPRKTGLWAVFCGDMLT